jgi:hypothetical protein
MIHRKQTPVSLLITGYLIYHRHGMRPCITDKALDVLMTGIVARGGYNVGEKQADIKAFWSAVGLAFWRADKERSILIHYAAYCIGGRQIKYVRKQLHLRHRAAWDWIDRIEWKIQGELDRLGIETAKNEHFAPNLLHDLAGAPASALD